MHDPSMAFLIGFCSISSAQGMQRVMQAHETVPIGRAVVPCQILVYFSA